MTTQQTKLKKKLKAIVQLQPHTLRGEVAAEALEHDDIASFFTDILTHGCQSGIVGKLIYYCDTHRFFDTHYEEIESLREELENSLGEPLHPQGDLKNWYAWLTFEETARMIADDLGLLC